jgi:hypothetical protein
MIHTNKKQPNRDLQQALSELLTTSKNIYRSICTALLFGEPNLSKYTPFSSPRQLGLPGQLLFIIHPASAEGK